MTAQAQAFDPVRALRSRGTLYTLATALQLSVAVLVLPAVTRLLPPGDYGVVAVAIVVQLALALIGAVGLPETLPRTFFRIGAERARALFSLTVVTSAAVALVAEVTGPFWSQGLLGLEYGAPMRLAVWSAVPLAVVMAAQAVLRAADRAIAFVVSAVLVTAGAQGLGLAFLSVADATPTTYLAGVALGITVAAIFAAAVTRPTARGLADRTFLGSSLRVSLPTVVHGLAVYLIWAGDRAVLNRLEGSAAVGRYHVAYLVGGLAILFISAIYSAWGPIVFRAPEEHRWAALADTTAAISRVAAAGAALTAIGAPLALVVLAPARYEPLDLAVVSALIALAAVPFVTYCSHLHILLWHGRTFVLAWVTPLVALVNVGANLALVPVLGLVGAAVATVISYALQATLVGVAARRLGSVPWRVRAFIEASVVSGSAVAVAAVVPARGAWLGVRAAVAAALFVWLVRVVVRLR